ncbi:MAG: LytTR family DNA-binding domain-containing protein [Oscillospiraceae bacterium]|nr:LytTR family DNA-binding domain-containing protein [Oscillospiraceae bacterium]
MTVMVCEDTVEERETLCFLVKRFFMDINCPVKIVAYENGESLLKDWAANPAGSVKIIFLDIYMAGMSGIEVARKIRETDGDVAIIFITSSRDHGLDGFSVQALQYLLKPVGYAEVESALNKCVKVFFDSIAFMEVLSDRLTVKVLLKDIMYIEVFNHACLIHTVSETLKCYRPLDEVDRQLRGMGARMFLRTHRSYIVNMRYIDDAADSDFLLKNGMAVPIRKKDKLVIHQAYRDYLFSMLRGL